jgi:hypothetical protein
MKNKLKNAYSKCMACGGKMKKGGFIKKSLIKAQKGMTVKPTADSTGYYKKEIKGYDQLIKSEPNTPIGKSNKLGYMDARSEAYNNLNRQSLKGKPGYDKNGFPIVSEKMKKGMNGMSVPRLQGSVVASTPMAKSGQSFAAKNAAKGSNLKAKAKSKLKKK